MLFIPAYLSRLSLRLRDIRLANVVILAFSFAMLFLCVSWDTVYAACTVQNTSINNNRGGVNTLGQSFTATCSGQISTISIRVNLEQSVLNGTLNIYSGESVAAPTYTQTGINLGPGIQTVTLTTPQSVTSGSQYTFTIVDTGTYSVIVSGDNPYAGGKLYWDGGFEAGADAYFVVAIADPPTPPSPTPAVPTLGVSSLIAFVLFLVSIGVYRTRKQS